MRRIHTLLFLVLPALFLLVLVPRALAEEQEPLVITLDNGVTVALIENHQSPVVALRVYVRTGSMHEGEYLGAGLSHFLEHLVSGGATSRRTEAESRNLLDSIGAQSNAYTTRDHIGYHITTASRFFDIALDLLSDWVMNSSITQKEFQREYEVIQREMESRRSDPRVMLHELMGGTMFKVHPARHPVIGYRDAFKGLTRDDVWKYYRRTYVPNNVLFAAAGDLDPKKALEKVRAAFSGFKRRPVPAITLPTEPPQLGKREAAREMPASQAYLMMGFRTIPLAHPDLYPLDLISFILSNGNSSRLVRELREEKRLVTSITTWSYTPGYDAGEFMVSATLASEKLADAQKAIMDELRRLTVEPVSEEELKQAKRQKISEHVFALQTAEAQAANLALDILAAHDPNFSRSYVQRIQETTAGQILEAARKYFSEEKLCVAVVRPPKAPSQSKAVETSTPAPGGRIEREVLGNGLRLLVKRNPSQPIVSMKAFFLAGVRAEPAGKSGLSMFTARMMPRGTTHRSAEEIARAFDGMGGALGASSGNNTLYLSAESLTEDFPKAIEVFADVVRNPTFHSDEVDRLRSLLVAARKRQQDNWRAELAELFRRNFFKFHPYRNSPLGSVADLQSLNGADLVKFHRRYCVPNNMVLAVVGDVDPSEVKKLVKRYFSNWPASPAFEPPSPEPEPPPADDRTMQQKTSHNIAGVFIGFPGITLHQEKDRYAMDVLDSLLSGIHLPRGWLHETLRGKGLVYEVHAYNFFGLEPGYFGIYAGCEPARAEEVKEIILQQVRRILTEKISPEALESARRICITADVLERQTNAQQATDAALNELYGLGLDFSRRYAEGILAVTEDDVKRVAQTYLNHYLCILMLPEQRKAL